MIIKNQISKLLIGCFVLFFSLLILSGCSTMKGWFSFLSDSNELKTAEQLDQKDVQQFMTTVKPIKGDADNQYKLARHFQKQNRHEIAVEEFLKTLKMDPTFYNAYNAMGVSYDYLKQHDSAIDAYNAALKINPNLDYVYNNIGYSNLLKGDLDAATIAFQRAIALNGDNEIYRNNLALAQVKSGKTTSMVADSGPSENQTVDLPKSDLPKVDPIVQMAPVSQETPIEVVDTADSENVEIVVETVPEATVEAKPETAMETPKTVAVQSPKIENNYYAVQLGVYYDLDKAVQTLKNAQKKGYDCPYITKIEKNKPYYRVRFGKYQKTSDAEKVASKNLDKWGRPALIVSEAYPVEVFHAEVVKKCSEIKVQHVVLDNKPLNIEVLNGNGVYRMAKRVSTHFEQKGFAVVRPANAKHFNYQATRIYYAPGNYQDAVKLSHEIPGFGIAGTFIESKNIETDIQVLIGKDIAPFNNELRKSLNI